MTSLRLPRAPVAACGVAAAFLSLALGTADQPPVPGVPGEPTGIDGLRKFPNPRFDTGAWDLARDLEHPGMMEPPYLIAMTPPVGTAARRQWFREPVEQPDLLDRDIVADDTRYSVAVLGADSARSLGTNATKGQPWDPVLLAPREDPRGPPGGFRGPRGVKRVHRVSQDV